MRVYHNYHSSTGSVRRFSNALQAWFPEAHRKTFPGTSNAAVIQSAVQRTLDLL